MTRTNNKNQIFIIAPASSFRNKNGDIDKETRLKRLQDTINFFEKNGFQCIYDEKIFVDNELKYFAAPKSERLRQLKSALLDPQVRIIFSLRGGYGSAEIAFDCLNITPSGPKILIGFSDITALHMLFQHYNMPSIHAIMDVTQEKMIKEVLEVIATSSPIRK